MTDRSSDDRQDDRTRRSAAEREGRAPQRRSGNPPEPTDEDATTMERADAANGEPDATES